MTENRTIPTLAAWASRPWAMDRLRLDSLYREIGAASLGPIGGPAATVQSGPAYEIIGTTAILEIVGPILKRAPSFLRNRMAFCDIDEARGQLAEALVDPDVDSIALWIDSPGGTVSGVQQFADEILAATCEKEVLAIVEDCCCSAAYWIASQADQIIANPTATVGSIGVYCVADDYSRMYENEGISTHVFASGPAKGQGSEHSERMTPPQMESMRAEVAGLAELFVQAVARGRNLAPEKARALATGGYWLAGEAARLGLIDNGNADVKAVLAAMAGAA